MNWLYIATVAVQSGGDGGSMAAPAEDAAAAAGAGGAGFGMLLLAVWGITTAALLAGAGVLHLLPRLGASGRRASDGLCAGYPLDLLVTYFTILPLIFGPILAGWAGLLGAILGQYSALILWTIAHELAHPDERRGPRIITVTNRAVGPARNLTAVFLTSLVVPLFWFVRLAQIFIYPPITWLVQLPPYRDRDWVAVSRHKFEGLIGHDRIWCLYCDWMTGVWSLGSEMLRNVESFWCPIRFASPEKCANCRVDFPDVEEGWVPADGTMADVKRALVEHYGEQGEVVPRSWWGHPSRKATRAGYGGTGEAGGNGDGAARRQRGKAVAGAGRVPLTIGGRAIKPPPLTRR